MIGEEGKNHYVLIKNFSTFMHDRMLHRGRKHVCGYCLQAFSTKEILKCHINNCFKINNKKGLRCLKKVSTLNSKMMTGK